MPPVSLSAWPAHPCAGAPIHSHSWLLLKHSLQPDRMPQEVFVGLQLHDRLETLRS